LRRPAESGFALLTVLLMAAVIAISLYLELPRVAFEAQRQKEQLLIERGEQYKRAIQVFFTTTKRYPARIEDLESWNGRRFLRRRYIDPMTGKDEWRLVHMQNGVLTDSVDTKQKLAEDQQPSGNSGQYVSDWGGIGRTPEPSGINGISAALRRRPSEGGANGAAPGGPGAQPDAGATPGASEAPATPPLPGDPGPRSPGGPAAQPNPPGLTGVQQPGLPAPSNAPVSGNPASTGSSAYITGGYGIGSSPTVPGPGANPTGQAPNPPFGSSSPPAPAFGASSQPAPAAIVQQPSVINPQAQSAAAAMIQQILTQPRPGGMPTAQAVMGSGIAGVASKADADSIMVYNTHTNYSGWEFIFDFTKYRPPANPLQGSPAMVASPLSTLPVGNPNGAPAAPAGGPWGPTPGAPGPPSPVSR
jgi:type II secretory pathway pseudopilin PulG